MSESYNPFTGISEAPRSTPSSASPHGKKLAGVDWKTTKLVPGKWMVFDSTVNVKAPPAAAVTSKKGGHVSSPARPQRRAVLPPFGEEETKKWYAEHDISIFGEGCPPPFPTFDHFPNLPEDIHESFRTQGFTSPTPIQSQAWPILLQNRDMVGIAKTGSGKTIAFMVPAIMHISVQEPLKIGDGPMVLVLAPTRELAQQIEAETRKVLPQKFRIACIYGGAPKYTQLQALRGGVHILVATPGRLIDFLEAKKTNLLRVTFLVMDEADRMLDMGFEPQVRQICSQIRIDRQTLMFSATWPKEIQKLAATFQRNFIRIHVGSVELRTNSDVRQHFHFVSNENEKFNELRRVLDKYKQKRVLVFSKMKRTTDFLERQLRSVGVNAYAIHGDKEQSQRDYVLDRFRKETDMVLVATDVAARGLDVKNLEAVVNYDFPMALDDYVHRIGRTGRAGAKGDAYSLLTKMEEQLTPQVVRQLIGMLEQAKQSVPPQLTEWSQQAPKYTPTARPGYGRYQRAPPLQYKHSNRPSFDPNAAPPPPLPQALFGVNTQPPASAPYKVAPRKTGREPVLEAPQKQYRPEHQ